MLLAKLYLFTIVSCINAGSKRIVIDYSARAKLVARVFRNFTVQFYCSLTRSRTRYIAIRYRWFGMTTIRCAETEKK